MESKEKFSKKYYEDIIEMLPKSENGIVEFRKSIFHKAVKEYFKKFINITKIIF
jgi:hypothetical protein